jgi:hypothetical protein
LALVWEAKGLPRYRFPSDAESARKLEEVDALISEAKKLLQEMVKLGNRICWSDIDCPLETALEINELAKRAEDFCEACYQYHYSLLEGKSVSDTEITGLREGYERLKEAWLEFLLKNRLGLIYL